MNEDLYLSAAAVIAVITRHYQEAVDLLEKIGRGNSKPEIDAMRARHLSEVKELK